MSPSTRATTFEWAPPLSVAQDTVDAQSNDETQEPYLATAAGELALFRALIQHRPVGVDKHWEMVKVALSLSKHADNSLQPQQRAQRHDKGEHDDDSDSEDGNTKDEIEVNVKGSASATLLASNKGQRRSALDAVDSATLWAKYRELYDEETLWSTWEGEVCLLIIAVVPRVNAHHSPCSQQLDKMDEAGLLPPTPDSESDSPAIDASELCMSFRFPKMEFTLTPHFKRIERDHARFWDKGLVGEFSQLIAERGQRVQGQDPDSPESLPVTEFDVEVPSEWAGLQNDDENGSPHKRKRTKAEQEPADEEEDDEEEEEEEDDDDDERDDRKAKRAGRDSPKGRGARSRAATKAVNERIKERDRKRKQHQGSTNDNRAGSSTVTPPSKRAQAAAADKAQDASGDISGSDLSELEDMSDDDDEQASASKRSRSRPNEDGNSNNEDEDEDAEDDRSHSRTSDHESTGSATATRALKRRRATRSESVPTSEATSVDTRRTGRIRKPTVKEGFEVETPSGNSRARRRKR
ncbi:hypothetical protein OIO90_006308 [Microbotryomycetes sp. JL221]|nr:hypothetical protein OIO90_006308 [Microbotryomycetes sp. JL221]